MAEKTMKAVIFKGPHKVAIEERPVPKIKDQTDIIVKVIYSALCGRLEIATETPFCGTRC
jgi:D-arabinose 1-dehydrogenase-like Zn-dependent alcohol dehydrogenase